MDYQKYCGKRFVNYQINAVPREIEADVGFQNRKLLRAFVHRAIEKTCVPSHKPEYGFKLYDLAMNIFMKTCIQVPERFLDNTKFLFKVLHYVSSEGRTELLSPENFKVLHDILHKCKDDIKYHRGFLDVCMERVSNNYIFHFIYFLRLFIFILSFQIPIHHCLTEKSTIIIRYIK